MPYFLQLIFKKKFYLSYLSYLKYSLQLFQFIYINYNEALETNYLFNVFVKEIFLTQRTL